MQYKVLNLDVVASYNQIDPTFPGRLSPERISYEVFKQEVSSKLNLAALLQSVQSEPIEAETLEQAKSVANALLKEAILSTGYTPTADSFYKPGPIHGMGMFLMKPGGAPWDFTITIQGKEIKGFVMLYLVFAPATMVSLTSGTKVLDEKVADAVLLGDSKAPEPSMEEAASEESTTK